MYFGDFKLLSEEEKESHLVASGVWAAPVLSLSDEDSTKTIPSYKACHIIMAAARHWHNLNEDTKCVWKKRAVKLNTMPVPGQFCSFPKAVSEIPRMTRNKILEEAVLDSLGGNWEMVSKVIKCAIYQQPGIVDSQ
eukprot:9363998-Ditylum_brightwellii.AAC.1